MFTHCTVSVGDVTRNEAQLIDHLREDDHGRPDETQVGGDVVQPSERQANDEQNDEDRVHAAHLVAGNKTTGLTINNNGRQTLARYGVHTCVTS